MSSNAKTIRFPEELYQQLKELAERQSLTFSQLIAQCCEFALGNMEEAQAGEECGDDG